METGLIFDIKRYAIHDGPGIRTTVFLKGCPLSCHWCANPESQSGRPELSYTAQECMGCGICSQTCPGQAVSMARGIPVIDAARCTLCGTCAENCPAEALQMTGRTVTVDGLYRDVCADRPFWDRSGGGVTLSGGEPLAQFDFTLAFLKTCRQGHVSTALETTLFAPWDRISTLLPFTDHLICDLKLMDDIRHKSFTGVSNLRIKENIRALLQTDSHVLVRMPLIPGINDAPGNLTAMGAFLESARPGTSVELLPYHRLGESKYQRMEKPYPLAHIRPPSRERMEEVRTLLETFDLDVCGESKPVGEPSHVPL